MIDVQKLSLTYLSCKAVLCGLVQGLRSQVSRLLVYHCLLEESPLSGSHDMSDYEVSHRRARRDISPALFHVRLTCALPRQHLVWRPTTRGALD